MGLADRAWIRASVIHGTRARVGGPRRLAALWSWGGLWPSTWSALTIGLTSHRPELHRNSNLVAWPAGGTHTQTLLARLCTLVAAAGCVQHNFV